MSSHRPFASGAMVNAYNAGLASQIGPAEREMIARRERSLGPAYRLFYRHPIHLVRGEGAWLYDDKGNAYLDAYNNVACVGHCHPRVAQAIADQARTLNTHTRYLHHTILDYAERLLATLPSALSHVMFACTGSEANDLAMRIAKTFTGGTGFVVTELAYHGVTDAVAQLSPSLGRRIAPGPHVRTVPAPDRNRMQAVGTDFGRNVEAAIAELQASGIKPAALIVDTIFSSDGVFPDPKGFLAPAVEAMQSAGGLFIADEVQPGLGRTGEMMWGFQRHGIVPDVVTAGKPMGNGHPLSALFVKPAVVAEFGASARYFNTFGGNPVSCAAGLAVLDVIESEGLMENARDVGNYLQEGLRELARRHAVIHDIRGAGLFVGVELIDPHRGDPATEAATNFVNAMRERFILLSATGPYGNVLKIRPPLVFSRANADLFLATADAVLSEFAPRG
ncbi:MAG: aspartate aminotransferase family protein [Pseudorhodoplanes sp.]|uniref:aspartate aminotransferase family protein n=1 Tax=Pseudorhodoplanes sp. TaxID=1934341 RepID=UPI003D0DA323